jgi:chromatin remodeling complex protein RSC6
MTEFNMTEFNMTKNINQYFTLSKTLASIIGKPIATESDINICILKYCKDNNLQCTDGYKLDKKLQSLFNIDKWDTETIDIHQLHHYLQIVVKDLDKYKLTKLNELKAQHNRCRDNIHIINKKLIYYNKRKQELIEEDCNVNDIVKVNKKLQKYNMKKQELEDEMTNLIGIAKKTKRKEHTIIDIIPQRYKISEELFTFIGSPNTDPNTDPNKEIHFHTRIGLPFQLNVPYIIRFVMTYAKTHGLIVKDTKGYIIPDTVLIKLFNLKEGDTFSFSNLYSYISKHFIKMN